MVVTLLELLYSQMDFIDLNMPNARVTMTDTETTSTHTHSHFSMADMRGEERKAVGECASTVHRNSLFWFVYVCEQRSKLLKVTTIDIRFVFV